MRQPRASGHLALLHESERVGRGPTRLRSLCRRHSSVNIVAPTQMSSNVKCKLCQAIPLAHAAASRDRSIALMGARVVATEPEADPRSRLQTQHGCLSRGAHELADASCTVQ